MWDWRIPARQKPLVALRLWYRGGYSYYFEKQVRAMLRDGYTQEELLAASVDDAMRGWIEKSLSDPPKE